MKTRILLTVLTVALAGAAHATLFNYSWNVGTTIPDGNPTGLANFQEVSGIPVMDDSIVSVTVTLNITGGFNGDLYGYLVSAEGTRIDLLNRIGQSESNPFGNSGSGINVTFDDNALDSIHDAPFTSVTGTYRPDGGTLGDLFGEAATGTWRLFLADLSGGDTSTLVSWGLQIEVVPEPTTWALGAFAVVFAGVGGFRAYRSARRKNA